MANTRLWSVDKDQPFTLAGRLIDPARRTITHEGDTVTVEPRVLALLLRLAESPDRPVRREALIEAVWPGSPGAESSLSNAVSLLRRALDDSDSEQPLIRTVPRIGYCLTEAPTPHEVVPDAAASSTPARNSRRAALAAVAALGVVALAAVVPRLGQSPVGEASLEDASGQPFVAVLPVEAPEDMAPIAHVLTRDAITRLRQARGYRVADPSEAYQVANGTLSADLVVSARLIDDGDGLQIEARWSRAGAEAPASVRRLSAPPGGVLGLRGDWLEAVLVETALAVTAGSGRRPDDERAAADGGLDDATWLLEPTDVPEAFEAYSLAAWYAGQYRADLMPDAIRAYERAVSLDPDFAPAWAELGATYMIAGSHQGVLEPGGAHVRARDALLRAIALQPDLAVAHDSLADYYNCIERDPLLAQRGFERVFSIDPDFASSGYTRLLLLHQSPAEARQQIERNLARFPDSLNWKLIAAMHLLAADDAASALRLSREAMEQAPNLINARLAHARALSALGRHDAAISALEALAADAGDSPRLAAHQVMVLARAGRSAAAESVLGTQLLDATDARPTHLAMSYAWTGRIDAAIEQLERAFEQREFGLCYIASEPVYEPLRGDARFDRLVQRMRGAK